MRTRLRSKVTLLLIVCAALLAVPGAAVVAQTSPGPTIQSDKADYAPGELVTLTGSGWVPGESVNVVVNDDVGQTWNRNVNVIADPSGNITDQFNLPDWFVATYSVTATGPQSGPATTSFTDGALKAHASGLTGTEQWTVTKTEYTSNNCTTGADAASSSQTLTTNADSGNLLSGGAKQSVKLVASANSNPAGKVFSSWTKDDSDLVVNPSGFTPGAREICVQDFASGNKSVTANYVAATVNTTTTALPASATYGDSSVTLNANVAPASGPAVNTGTVTFTVKNGATTIGTVTSGTVSGGNASASFPLSGVNAGSYTIEAAYNAGTGFNASNNSAQPPPTLTVNQKTVTGSFTADNKVYDGGTSATILTRSLTG